MRHIKTLSTVPIRVVIKLVDGNGALLICCRIGIVGNLFHSRVIRQQDVGCFLC
jgi:hypothetical protein